MSGEDLAPFRRFASGIYAAGHVWVCADGPQGWAVVHAEETVPELFRRVLGEDGEAEGKDVVLAFHLPGERLGTATRLPLALALGRAALADLTPAASAPVDHEEGQ